MSGFRSAIRGQLRPRRHRRAKRVREVTRPRSRPHPSRPQTGFARGRPSPGPAATFSHAKTNAYTYLFGNYRQLAAETRRKRHTSSRAISVQSVSLYSWNIRFLESMFSSACRLSCPDSNLCVCSETLKKSRAARPAAPPPRQNRRRDYSAQQLPSALRSNAPGGSQKEMLSLGALVFDPDNILAGLKNPRYLSFATSRK